MKALLISLLSLAFGAWYFLPVAPHAPAPSEVSHQCSASTTNGNGTCSITCPSGCTCHCAGNQFGCACSCDCPSGGRGGGSQAFIDVNLAPEQVLQKAKSILERDGSAVALRIAEQLDELMQLDPATEAEAIASRIFAIDELMSRLDSDTLDELMEIDITDAD